LRNFLYFAKINLANLIYAPSLILEDLIVTLNTPILFKYPQHRVDSKNLNSVEVTIMDKDLKEMSHDELVELSDKLRLELEDLIYEKDYLDCHLLPQLNAKYNATLGTYKLEMTQIRLGIMTYQRKIEVIQSLINHGEYEENLDDILKKFDVDLERQMAHWEKTIVKAIEYTNNPDLEDVDANEIKSDYKFIMKRIHPDLNSEYNPDLIDKFEHLYNIAYRAYKNGNGHELHAVRQIITKYYGDDKVKSDDDLREEVDRFQESLFSIKKYIRTKHHSFPYNNKDMILDSALINHEADILKKDIEKEKAVLDEYKKRFKLATEAYQHGKAAH
jgi:hypothetical protein